MEQKVFSTTNPNQITGLTEAGKNVALGLVGLGGIVGIEVLKPGPVNIQQELRSHKQTLIDLAVVYSIQ